MIAEFSERLFENICNCALIDFFRRRGFVVENFFIPTQREENERGYDAMFELLSENEHFNLFIQYKRPNYLRIIKSNSCLPSNRYDGCSDKFYFKINNHQHQSLINLGNNENNYVYYISPLFHTMEQCQQYCNRNSYEILQNSVAIPPIIPQGSNSRNPMNANIVNNAFQNFQEYHNNGGITQQTNTIIEQYGNNIDGDHCIGYALCGNRGEEIRSHYHSEPKKIKIQRFIEILENILKSNPSNSSKNKNDEIVKKQILKFINIVKKLHLTWFVIVTTSKDKKIYRIFY